MLSPQLKILLVFFGLMAIFFKPNPEPRTLIRLSDLLLFGSTIFLVCLAPVFKYKISKFELVPIRNTLVIYICFTITFIYGSLNGTEYYIRDLFELYRPLMYIGVFIFGSICSKVISLNTLMRFLLIFLLIQVALGFLQRYNLLGINSSPLNLLYSMHKVKTYQGRIVGTLSNPNAFGFVLNMMFFVFYFYLKSKMNLNILHNLSLFLIHAVLILFSSSRTGLVVVAFFWMVVAIEEYRRNKGLGKLIVFTSLGFFSLLLIIFWEKVLALLQTFSYIYETFKPLIRGEGFFAIRQVASRLVHYEGLYDSIMNNPILGVGPQKSKLSLGDNSYLFTLLQWGVLGCIAKYGFFISLVVTLKRVKNDLFLKKAISWMCIALFIGGLTVESFNNLKYIPMVLILAGYCYGYRSKSLESK